MKSRKTVIVGAGASGLFCANLLQNECVLLEGANEVGKKLAISGGGRCNFTNLDMSASHFSGSKELIQSALSALSPIEIIRFITSLGLLYETKNKSQIFLKNSAKEFVEKLKDKRIKVDQKVFSVKKIDNQFIVYTQNAEYTCKNLVIASGGLSYPALGASGVGHEITKLFGHKIITPKPALVGLTIQPNEAWFKELSGVSLKVRIKVANKTFDGDLLFTHKGVSGPVILNASLYHEKGFISVDFAPNFDLKDLVGQKQISSILPTPKRFTKSFLDSQGLSDKVCAKLTKSDFETLHKLKNYEFAPAGTFGYSKAEITKGGVYGDEIEPATFESKLCKGLYIIGEALDVNGELGGYNIHFAFASASVCAKSLSG